MTNANTRSRRFPIGSLSILSCMLGCAAPAWAADRSPVGTYITIPDTISAGPGLSSEVERGLFFVPENRRDPDSRVIAIHFLRFPALQSPGGPRRPPIFVLPGGPGDEFSFKTPLFRRPIERLRRTREVVYVSQRGNPEATGLVANLRAAMEPPTVDQPSSTALTKERQRAAVRQAVEKWTRRGVDLRGYDILNIVDDVYELRAALGYDKIVLQGCSFGSQWSFSYLKRWPQTVDRALLSGVEPLDYAYDSPKWLWASLTRLANRAEANPEFAKHVPPGGVMAALQSVIERLEKQPATVTIEDPKTGKPVQVVVGANDLRQMIASAIPGETRDEQLGNWPRFILEMYRGDYRYVAARSWQSRNWASRAGGDDAGGPLIGVLIDNSLGISAARDAKLLAEPEARWLGDINSYYRNTRDLTPTPDVGDAFRADWPIEVPVLLVNGDLDWSTSIENARHARRHLKQGHLIEIEGGVHCDESVTMPQELPAESELMYSFIDADFQQTTPQQLFATLPTSVAYRPLNFAAPVGPSLYEQWQLSRRSAATAR